MNIGSILKHTNEKNTEQDQKDAFMLAYLPFLKISSAAVALIIETGIIYQPCSVRVKNMDNKSAETVSIP